MCRGAEIYRDADVQALPFDDKEFGVVFCSHVLEHLPSAEVCAQAWGELHRVAG